MNDYTVNSILVTILPVYLMGLGYVLWNLYKDRNKMGSVIIQAMPLHQRIGYWVAVFTIAPLVILFMIGKDDL